LDIEIIALNNDCPGVPAIESTKFNTAGVGFGGVGLRLPKDVFYVFKCYTLPEYRGANLAGLSIYNGAMALGKGDGWLRI